LSKGRSKFERYAVESQAIQVNKANADLWKIQDTKPG
jgi:hypothetical protein